MPKLITTHLRIKDLGTPSTYFAAIILFLENNIKKLTLLVYFVIPYNYLVLTLVTSPDNNGMIKEF